MDCLVDAIYEHSSAKIAELNERTLFVSVGGDVRDEDVEPFFEILQPLVGQRTRVLIDATYLAEVTLPLRWQILKRIGGHRARVERTAIFGLSPKLETLLWLFFTLSGRRNIRTFLWRHEAENWILES